MRLNILFGGKAGQGINKISDIVSNVLSNYGYYTFNYRDYPSLIRGGHNFNVLSISNEEIGSNDSLFDAIVALDETTTKIHKPFLKKEGFIISTNGFENLGMNLNIALAGSLIKTFGIEEKYLIEEIKSLGKDAILAAGKGYANQTKKFDIPKLKNKIEIMDGGTANFDNRHRSRVNVVDYKTGRPKSRGKIEGASRDTSGDSGEEDLAEGNIKCQLVFYKLLLSLYKEGKKFDMVSGEIDFVEPDEKGRYKKEKFEISDKEVDELKNLVRKVSGDILGLCFWNSFCGDEKCEFCELRKMMTQP